ncbi:MAG: zinc ribbon domain-containing protein [Defluviitaleaceae bacterium]|nr:zinc ribbon domain-containing protein [Defluviitaleaceae bacterium]
MPFYDLRCTECKSEHNISASMKEKSEKKISCPDCGSHELETIFRTPPAVVKGMPDFACSNRGSGCGSSCPHAG